MISLLRKPQSILLMLACLVLVTTPGCKKRYWYRKKISSPFSFQSTYPVRTVKIEIENDSPEFISKHFEEMVKKAGMKALSKRGFIPPRKDTPDVMLYIFLRVDSFYVYGSGGGGMAGINSTHIVTKSRMSAPSLNQRPSVRELTLSYRMVAPKTGILYWSLDDGLFFFTDEERDIRRTTSMVRYDLGHVK